MIPSNVDINCFHNNTIRERRNLLITVIKTEGHWTHPVGDRNDEEKERKCMQAGNDA